MAQRNKAAVWAVLAVLMAPAAALAQCGNDRVLVDRGLHRQWRVQRDCTHPAWPARLVEVPWREAAAKLGSSAAFSRAKPGSVDGEAPLPVRAGMQVTVVYRTGEAEIRLLGTALEGGPEGAGILVKAGLGAALRGIVRGPALVELAPQTGETGRF